MIRSIDYRVSSVLGNVGTSVAYNGFGEITSLASTANGGGVLSDALSRDALGRLVQKTETIAGSTDTYAYSYDAVGQLTSVSKNGTVVETYGYDGNGDRTSASTGSGNVTATYDDQDRIVQYGTLVHSYGGAGDLASKSDGVQTTSYQYDQLGNLLTVALPGGTAISYVVDGKNRRIGKKINGALVKGFLYSDRLHPVAELDSSGAVVSFFVYGGGNVPSYLVKGGVEFRILSDQLGTCAWS